MYMYMHVGEEKVVTGQEIQSELEVACESNDNLLLSSGEKRKSPTCKAKPISSVLIRLSTVMQKPQFAWGNYSVGYFELLCNCFFVFVF